LEKGKVKRGNCSFTPTFQSEQGAYSEKGIKKESLQCKANASCLPSRKKATHRQAGAATNELSKVNFATTINPY
jgi:hypothetical protein